VRSLLFAPYYATSLIIFSKTINARNQATKPIASLRQRLISLFQQGKPRWSPMPSKAYPILFSISSTRLSNFMQKNRL
jgi:hypothetical protein